MVSKIIHHDRCMTASTNSKTFIPTRIKGISDNYDRLHPQYARTGHILSYHLFGCNRKGNQENGYIILLLLNEAQLELE